MTEHLTIELLELETKALAASGHPLNAETRINNIRRNILQSIRIIFSVKCPKNTKRNMKE